MVDRHGRPAHPPRRLPGRDRSGDLEQVLGQETAGALASLVFAIAVVILKADVQGSVEVLRGTLEKLSTAKVKVRVIRAGVGAIAESDVLLATTLMSALLGWAAL